MAVSLLHFDANAATFHGERDIYSKLNIAGIWYDVNLFSRPLSIETLEKR